MPLTRDDILQGHDKAYPLTPVMEDNLARLLTQVNMLEEEYPEDFLFKVTSGYRPPPVNQRVGGAKRSAHLICEAVDIADPGGKLAKWCYENQDVLEFLGLCMEHPSATKGWLHVDLRERYDKNGKRVWAFFP